MLNMQNDDTCTSEISSANGDDFETIDVLSSGKECSVVELEQESEDDKQDQDDIEVSPEKKKRAKRVPKRWVLHKEIEHLTFPAVMDTTAKRQFVRKVLNDAEADFSIDSCGYCSKNERQGSADKYFCEWFCAGKNRFGCSFSCKIIVNFSDETAAIFTAGSHVHCEDKHATQKRKSKTGAWGIAPNHRHFIQTKIGEGQTAKQILKLMRKENLEPLPSYQQLCNFISVTRKELFSEFAEDDLGTFSKWLDRNGYREDLADDEMFVLPDPLLPEEISWGQGNLKIVAALSTKTLLTNAIHQQDSSQPSFVTVDGTYSLLANGWPTVVLGTVDWNHMFRCVGIAISSNEDEECFDAAIQSISKGITVIHPGRSLKPSNSGAMYTMQDGAKAIFNAVTTNINPKIAMNCWFHMKQSLHKRKSGFDIEANYSKFAADVECLHAAQSKTEFDHGASLFMEKWTALEPTMAVWMQEEYFRWRQYFYASCSQPGLPSVNNSQESFHKWMKEHGTSRKRLSCGAFLHIMRDYMKDLSHPMEHGRPFPESFTLDYSDWRKAQEWANSTVNTHNLVFMNEAKSRFCVPAASFLEGTPCREEVKVALQRWKQSDKPIRHEDFDAYFARRAKFYVLKKLQASAIFSPFILFSCSCTAYNKTAFCKHSLGLGIMQKEFNVPAHLSLDAIGPKKKRGRKKIASNVRFEGQEATNCKKKIKK
jgi:hypothetical protein